MADNARAAAAPLASLPSYDLRSHLCVHTCACTASSSTVSSHLSPITYHPHLSPITLSPSHLSPITYHLSPITYHPSPITYHPSPSRPSPITYHCCHPFTLHSTPDTANLAAFFNKPSYTIFGPSNLAQLRNSRACALFDPTASALRLFVNNVTVPPMSVSLSVDDRMEWCADLVQRGEVDVLLHDRPVLLGYLYSGKKSEVRGKK